MFAARKEARRKSLLSHSEAQNAKPKLLQLYNSNWHCGNEEATPQMTFQLLPPVVPLS